MKCAFQLRTRMRQAVGVLSPKEDEVNLYADERGHLQVGKGKRIPQEE